MMIKCPNCGTEIEDSAKFCYCCGSSIENSPEGLSSPLEALADTATDYMDELAKSSDEASQVLFEEQPSPSEDTADADYLEALQKAEAILDSRPAAPQPEAPAAAAPKASNSKRIKTLLSAMWESGKLKATVAAILAFAVLAILFGGGFTGGKSVKVPDNGFSRCEDLIDTYIKAMKKEDYDSAVKCLIPQVAKYYRENYSESSEEIIQIADDAFYNNGKAYTDLKNWKIGSGPDEQVDWDSDEYYSDTFELLGLPRSKGRDIQVTYNWKSIEDDYYVFEMVNVNGRWYLLSIYY